MQTPKSAKKSTVTKKHYINYTGLTKQQIDRDIISYRPIK